MRHDLGKMTAEETQDLMREVIELLTEEQLFDVLNSALSSEQKGELAVAWANDND